MAEKKQDSFVVNDRRLFNSEGELRTDATEEQVPVSKPASETVAPPKPQAIDDAPVPPPPSSAEQEQQADAYRKSSKELDARVELSGHSAKDLEMTFERFLASLYMTAMLQLGLMHQEGEQPRIDIVGARQTIDTIGLISEKTKGNLTAAEQNFLQNSLYELRMAYVEVTNALARPPQATGTGPVKR
ncbi:MAG TPA: DUF1844 domain-containing protein [Terriglobales bacterium]|jgi:hypothetical protein